MKYVSTRGEAAGRGFAEILLEGLAPDGGLYVPERYPRIDATTLAAWRRLSYPDLAFAVMSLFVDDIPASDLHALVQKSYRAEVFGGDPRIAPLRVGATLAYGNGPWGARFGFDYNAAQHRVPSVGARETDAYTLWNAAITYKMKVQRANLTWYARIDNITNKLAYSATSILTSTVYPNAPLPGRTLKVGLRVTF